VLIQILYRTFSGNKVIKISQSQILQEILALYIIFLVSLNFLSGGDHFNYFRMLQPVYPFMIMQVILVLGNFIENLFNKSQNRFSNSILIPGLVVLSIWSIFFSVQNSWWEARSQGSQIAHEFQISRNGRLLGLDLNRKFQSLDTYPSVGVITAGGIARTYKGRIYDLMGLNNEFIGHFHGNRIGIKNHAAFEKSAFFQLPVEHLIDGPDSGFAQVAYKGLFSDKEFVSKWMYGYLIFPNSSEYGHEGFYSKNYLSKLKPDIEFKQTKQFDAKKNQWSTNP
jgi:hypothetical protein